MSHATVPQPGRTSHAKPKTSTLRRRRRAPTVAERVRAARELAKLRLPVGSVEQMKKESVPAD